MEAAVLYGIWVYRAAKASPGEGAAFNIDVVPELKGLLEEHLDPLLDRSLAVRAVYGRWLPHLGVLDSAWTKAQLDRIFPIDPDFKALRKAAWDTFISYAPLWRGGLDAYRGQYETSVDLLEDDDNDGNSPAERLGRHLMVFYLTGEIELADPIIRRFFERASSEIRKRALGFVGRDLRNAEGPISSERIERLKALWEWRLKKCQEGSLTYPKDEMASFGWWFVSDKLEPGWTIQQLQSALQLAPGVEVDYDVAEALAKAAEKWPGEATKCIELMVEGAVEDWQVQHWAPQIEVTLRLALASDHQTVQRARSLINKLCARGFLSFGTLLD